jgi:hypothetical protein
VNLFGMYGVTQAFLPLLIRSRGAIVDIPKTSPESVAGAIFDGVQSGEEDIFPDPMAQSMAESWRSGAAKALERQFAALLDAAPVTP